MNKEFQEELATRTRQIEAVIEKYLPCEQGYQRTVIEAMNYSIQAGGKRLRPMLMWETYRMFGGRSEVIEPFEPGNGQIGKALRVLAQKAGVHGMLGGQCADVEGEGKPMSEEMLTFIYRLKTGALLEASMLIGAMLAGATNGEQAQVEQAAGELGLAFQIQDDILDVTSTTEELGKPVGSDEKNNKTTWVTLFGTEQAKQEVERLSRQSVERINTLVVKNEFLVSLMMELIHRKK